jgi:hypothetical protein
MEVSVPRATHPNLIVSACLHATWPHCTACPECETIENERAARDPPIFDSIYLYASTLRGRIARHAPSVKLSKMSVPRTTHPYLIVSICMPPRYVAALHGMPRV